MERIIQHQVRIAIVEAGNVGATCAYALLLNGIASEIVLIDLNLNQLTLDAESRAQIAENKRGAAYEIIRRKGATYYAIGAGLARLIEAIVRNENGVLTVSSLAHGMYGLNEVCLSLPSVVNHYGIERMLELPLDEAESGALENSARVIRKAILSLESSAT